MPISVNISRGFVARMFPALRDCKPVFRLHKLSLASGLVKKGRRHMTLAFCPDIYLTQNWNGMLIVDSTVFNTSVNYNKSLSCWHLIVEVNAAYLPFNRFYFICEAFRVATGPLSLPSVAITQ